MDILDSILSDQRQTDVMNDMICVQQFPELCGKQYCCSIIGTCKDEGPVVRRHISPTAHKSDNPLVRRLISPTDHQSNGPLVRQPQPISPTTHQSDNPLVRHDTSSRCGTLFYIALPFLLSVSFSGLFSFLVIVVPVFMEVFGMSVNWEIKKQYARVVHTCVHAMHV